MTTTTRYTTPETLQAAAYGLDIPEAHREQVEALLAKAERRLINRVKHIPKRIDQGKLTAEEVADVVHDMVLRVVKNPGGYSSEQAGEFSYRLDWAAASGRIHITKEDLKNLGIGTNGPAVGVMWSKPSAWRIR